MNTKFIIWEVALLLDVMDTTWYVVSLLKKQQMEFKRFFFFAFYIDFIIIMKSNSVSLWNGNGFAIHCYSMWAHFSVVSLCESAHKLRDHLMLSSLFQNRKFIRFSIFLEQKMLLFKLKPHSSFALAKKTY